MTDNKAIKKILWVLPYLPWPITSGGKSRQYHLMRSLAERGHKITLLIQSKTTIGDESVAELAFLEKIIVLPRRKILSIKTLSTILFSRYPLLVCINGFNTQLSARFEQLLSQPWDVIQIEHSYSFQPYADVLRRKEMPFILTEHNVESGLGAATYSRLPFFMQWYSAIDRYKYRNWEKEVMQAAEQVVAVTDEDANELATISGRNVNVVINGVDTQGFESVSANFNEKRILFVGNYEYAPNVDAVEWMMNEIMPQVWATHADVKVMICGYAMPEEWAKQWPDPRIEWQGYIADLTQAQAQSSVFIAALRSGGGSKLKVLEAMAAGLPLVSTSQGVSGLDIDLNTHYLGGDNSDALSQGLCRIFNEPDNAKRMAERSRDHAQTSNDWSIAAQQLADVYEMLP